MKDSNYYMDEQETRRAVNYLLGGCDFFTDTKEETMRVMERYLKDTADMDLVEKIVDEIRAKVKH